jgi:hypothetical protein
MFYGIDEFVEMTLFEEYISFFSILKRIVILMVTRSVRKRNDDFSDSKEFEFRECRRASASDGDIGRLEDR